MPGCPLCLFFPRLGSLNYANTMMWDVGENQSLPNGRRSPNPRLPLSSPWAAQGYRPMPLSTPDVPPLMIHGSKPFPTYHTFPRSPSHFVPESSPQHLPSSVPMPVPLPTKPSELYGQPFSGHQSSHKRSHRKRATSAESRHVHYADEGPRQHVISQSGQLRPILRKSGSSQHLPQVRDEVRQTGDGRRVRVLSGGSTVPRPMYRPQLSHHPHFQYSKCTGRKKALCIGINYVGHKRELRGCVNDVKNIKHFLTTNKGFRGEDILTLMDETSDPRNMPTRRNMIEAMRWLIHDARPHDSLFFHYSGHGGQIPDRDGDEIDGFDEVIYPVDYRQAGVIVDDEMHKIMVRPLPPGCRLTAIFDSCHSGTALDLPYIYYANGRLQGNHVSSRARALKATPADVISFTACKDDQTSADTVQRGVAVGAMSYAFILSLTKKPVQSYSQLLVSIREILRQYEQKAQLSSSHPIDTGLQFIL